MFVKSKELKKSPNKKNLLRPSFKTNHKMENSTLINCYQIIIQKTNLIQLFQESIV